MGELLHASGSYVQDWLLQVTDYNWRVEAGEAGQLRAVADIGTHWLDLVQFVTGQKVTAVCADLQTVHPVRQRPAGSVETFSGQGHPARATEPVAVSTDDAGSVLLRFAGGGRGAMSVSQVTAGRKNCLRFEIAGTRQALAWNSERPNELWIGQRDQPNELLLRDPALLGPAPGRLPITRAGTTRAFPTRSSSCFAAFTDTLPPAISVRRRPSPRLPTGITRCSSARRSCRAARERRWINIEEIVP